MFKPDGAVVIDTRLNTGGLTKGVAGLKNQFGALGGSIKKLGGIIAAAFSVKAIVSFSKEAIELGSDLQEVQNVVDVTFTTMNEQVNKFAQNAAKTAGLSETMAKKYMGTFGAMSKSFGFTEEEAYNMSSALTQMSGDVASFYNLTQDAAYTKLKSVFTGETESLKDLGVVMTQTALDDFALRRGLGKTTSQMSEQEKVALRYQFVMEQLSGASGDFVRTQDGWANQTRILNLQFEQLKATLGQGLINVLTPALKVLNTMIGKLQEFAAAFKNVTAALFGNASEGGNGVAESTAAAAENAGQLEENVEAAGDAAKKAMAGFDEINVLTPSASAEKSATDTIVAGKSNSSSSPIVVCDKVEDNVTPQIEIIIENIKSKFAELSQMVTTSFSPTISSWGDAFSSLIPHIENMGARIKDAFVNLWKTSLSPFGEYIATDFVPSIYNDFSTNLAPVFSDIMTVAMDTWTTDFENRTLLIQKYCSWLKVAFENVKMVFSDMCASISSNWDVHGGSLMQNFTEFKNGLWDAFWFIYESVIEPVLSYCNETFDELWENHLSPLWDGIVNFVMSVVDNVMTLWNKTLKPIVDWLIVRLLPPITAIWHGVVDGIKIVIGWVADLFRAVLKWLGGMVDFIVGVFTLDFEKAWEGIKKAFGGIWDGMKAVVTGTVNGIIRVINQLIAAVYSGIAGVVNGVGHIVAKFGELLGKDWGFSLPNEPPKIPYLAQGAVIPPNAPFMAVLGDQRHGTNIEAPLDTIKQALAEVLALQENSFESVTNINFTGDLAQLARVLKPAIDTETRRKGGSLAKGGAF